MARPSKERSRALVKARVGSARKRICGCLRLEGEGKVEGGIGGRAVG